MMGNDERATRSVIGNDERVTRSVMGTTTPMRSVLGGSVWGDAISMDQSGWIGLQWGAIGLGGSVFDGDAISVVVRDIWRHRC